MNKKSLLKGHLAKCECSLISAADAGDAHVLDGADPETSFGEMLAGVRSARQALDHAHKLLAENDDGDSELGFTPARRKSRLDALDRAPVGRSTPRIVSIPSGPRGIARGIGGAYLAEQEREDEHRKMRSYWGM